MNALTLSLANAIGARLHAHPRTPLRRDPARCPAVGHSYPAAAVDRHHHGVDMCPHCAAPVVCVHLCDSQVVIPPHRRLSSVIVRTVNR